MSMHDDIKTVLVSEEQLKAKVAELGAQISRDYAGKNLVLVSILKGSAAPAKAIWCANWTPWAVKWPAQPTKPASNTGC